MKIFISGQLNDAENIQALMAEVRRAGHQVTHDWTRTDAFLGGRDAKLTNSAESGKRAENDIQGVLDSDVYVLASNNEQVGKGMYVELGAALALHQAQGKPLVYIIGKMNHLSVFYLHPAVRHAETLADVLSSAGKLLPS
jgi:hypothetical protein